MVLVEATMALMVLTAVSLMMLKLALGIVAPRQWTLQQSVTDAYLTFEKAFAERVEFDRLTANDSPWPLYPASSSQQVELGRLPGGRPLLATLRRTRQPDANNLPAQGGTGTVATNPAGMETWRLQSLVSYRIGGRTYVKSRTIVRAR